MGVVFLGFCKDRENGGIREKGIGNRK